MSETASLLLALDEATLRRELAHELPDAPVDEIKVFPWAPDPFQPAPQRDLPSVLTVVEFSAAAIAGGLLYDVVKAALERIARRHGVTIRALGIDGAPEA